MLERGEKFPIASPPAAATIPVPPGRRWSRQSVMATAGEGEAMRQKKRKMKKHKEQVGVAPSPSPHAPATPESKPRPLIPPDQTPAPSAAPETPILEEEAAAATARRTKERKRKKRKEGQEQVAAPSPPSPPAAAQTSIFEEEGEAVMARKKRKRKRWKHEEKGEEQMPSSPSPPTAAGIPLLEEEEEETAMRRKQWKRRRGKEKQEQAGTSPAAPAHPPSGQSPLTFDPGCSDQTHCVHLQGTPAPAPTPPPPEEEQEEADGPKGKGVKRSNGKKPHVLSTREIIKMRMELRKQQLLPKGFVAAMTMISNPNSDSNCIEQNTNHSSPFGAFFDQFCYKPVRQDRNPALPRTPDRLARPPPRGNPSSEWSHLTANETSKAAKANTSIASKSKQPGSGSGSVPGSQAKVKVKEKEKPAKKMMMKKQRKPPPLLTWQRKPPPLLTRAEKCSDKYRRLPLDQLVAPPRSPHKLLQEKYASDPWKVVVICMLLNLTHGKQVRKKVKGFFKRYPDAQTAFNADPEKMAKYLAPLGLQRVKANRIQKFSKAYVEKEWTYITELCGVGKYAADAYAIFCAGRATEVVPEDHKLVDYWKYVCFELPTVQRTQNVQEAVVTELENVVPKVQELAVC